MECLECWVTEEWVGHRRVLNRRLIWPDLCFGKTVPVSICRLDGGRQKRRRKKGKESFRKLLREMILCLKDVAAEKGNYKLSRCYRWRNDRLGIGAMVRERAPKTRSAFLAWAVDVCGEIPKTMTRHCT